MADYWSETTLTASLGYVEFPIADRQVSIGRNFARNVYPYRRGQGVEDLGRKVYAFNLTVPLFRGVDESHYPDTYLRLLSIIEDDDLRGEVEYVDPEFGPLDVKIVDYSWRTEAGRRQGGVLTIQLEERGFEQSLLESLSHFAQSGPTRAAQHAQDVDFDAAATGETVGFSLTAAWQKFQAAIDQGALAADEIAAQLDELYLVAEKVVAFSAEDEIERFSLYNSLIDFLGASEDVAEDAADKSVGAQLVEVVLPDDMDMFQAAARYLGDAGRAEEISFHNQGDPLLYARGTLLRVPAA
jgi:prophage DNA circulation protein